MRAEYHIPEPLLFNPLKHHLGYIREFINLRIEDPSSDIQDTSKELKHLGTSVMDVYTGSLSLTSICNETKKYLKNIGLLNQKRLGDWAGINADSFRIISLSDGSQWTIKYQDNMYRFVHFFPARNSQHTFRVKANTLKSAVIYNILIGKDIVTSEDLNSVRPLLGLSPVKDPIDTEAILEMIEIIRES